MKFKMEPLPHQRVEFERTKKRKNFARWWEMGLGKTKTSLDEASFLYSEGHIEALIVFAPNGVHTAWALDEIPKHCPVEYNTFLWESKKAKNKSFDIAFHRFMMDDKGLKIFCINHEGIMTKKCWNLIKKFMGKWKTFMVVDEGHCFKTPGAKRTMRILSIAKYADARRVLTGTPITNSPFDVYSQMKILNKDFWKEYELDDYTIFKHHFGVIVKRYFGEREFEQCVAYKNLEELKDIVGEHSSRLLKDDVLDLPPKLYGRRYFDMSGDGIRIYNELEKEFMTYINGELVTAELAIVRMQRLQQITSGYLPTDDGEEPLQLIGDENLRIKCLLGLVEEIPHKAIIWCKYKMDVQFVLEALKDYKVVDYYGDTKTEDRLKNKEAFINGDAQFFVATEACAGTGLNLTVAKTVVYYNTTFKLHHRLQSEDRAHRVGQDRSVNYWDLIASGTIDIKIIQRLIGKKDIANVITGDDMKKWL